MSHLLSADEPLRGQGFDFQGAGRHEVGGGYRGMRRVKHVEVRCLTVVLAGWVLCLLASPPWAWTADADAPSYR